MYFGKVGVDYILRRSNKTNFVFLMASHRDAEAAAKEVEELSGGDAKRKSRDTLETYTGAMIYFRGIGEAQERMDGIRGRVIIHIPYLEYIGKPYGNVKTFSQFIEERKRHDIGCGFPGREGTEKLFSKEKKASRFLNVYKMNDYDWVAADTLMKAVEWYHENVEPIMETEDLYKIRKCDIEAEGTWIETNNKEDIERLRGLGGIVATRYGSCIGDLQRRYGVVFKYVSFKEALGKYADEEYKEPFVIASTEW